MQTDPQPTGPTRPNPNAILGTKPPERPALFELFGAAVIAFLVFFFSGGLSTQVLPFPIPMVIGAGTFTFLTKVTVRQAKKKSLTASQVFWTPDGKLWWNGKAWKKPRKELTTVAIASCAIVGFGVVALWGFWILHLYAQR